MKLSCRWLGLFGVVLICFGFTSASEIYRTDFEAASVGAGFWGGFDGWVTNAPAAPAQGIDLDLIPGGGLGKTAFIGFGLPPARQTTVARLIGHDIIATGIPVIRISTLMGIEDSKAPRTARDDFYLSFYNTAGVRMAALRFDNELISAPNSRFGIWRESNRLNATGVNITTQFDTLINFIHGELFDLELAINADLNLWSANIGGLPLFEDAPFTEVPLRNFGFVAFEWLLSGTAPAGYGNNFLVVADFAIQSVPVGIEPFSCQIEAGPGGQPLLSWPMDPGFRYQVERSEDLKIWDSNLPGGSQIAGNLRSMGTFTDSDASPMVGARFYRVLRLESTP